MWKTPGNRWKNPAKTVKIRMETLLKARCKPPVTADRQGEDGCGKQAGVVWAAIGHRCRAALRAAVFLTGNVRQIARSNLISHAHYTLRLFHGVGWRVTAVSPAGSVGASACGRGCHWQPAPRLRGSQGCFGFKKKFSVKVELPCPLRRRRGWIARRARRVRFEPARCASFPTQHNVAPISVSRVTW